MITYDRVERHVGQTAREALREAIDEEFIRASGVDLEDIAENIHSTAVLVSNAVMVALVDLGLVGLGATPPPPSLTMVDGSLYGNLKGGFDEGREPRQGTQTPGESATTPEQYEQLQLPGMEDY